MYLKQGYEDKWAIWFTAEWKKMQDSLGVRRDEGCTGTTKTDQNAPESVETGEGIESLPTE